MTPQYLPLPEFISLASLPLLPVREHRNLPKEGGIYFVLDEDGGVRYVGRTMNLHTRWLNHHRIEQYCQKELFSIAWLVVSHAELLPAIEQACIDYFHPSDNVQRSRNALRILKLLIEDDQLRRFRAGCVLRATSPTKEVGRLIVEQLALWELEERENLSRHVGVPSAH